MTTSVLCGRCGAEQTTDVAVICSDCGATVHTHLRSVRDVLELLNDTAARLDRIEHAGGGSDDDVRRTLDSRFPLTAASTKSPVSFGATEAVGEVVRVVRYWARRLAEDAIPPDLPFCTHPSCYDDLLGPECPQSHAAAERTLRRVRFLDGLSTDPAIWLADRWQLVRRQTWAPDLAGDLSRVMGRAYGLIDQPPQTWFAGRCDVELADPDMPGTTYVCGWLLEGRLDEAVVRCRGCGTQHDVAERREAMVARMPDRLVTAADAARALSTRDRPVTSSMVRGWKRLGHLEPADVDERGKPLYRLADVLAVDKALRWGARTSTPGRAS